MEEDLNCILDFKPLLSVLFELVVLIVKKIKTQPEIQEAKIKICVVKSNC